MENNPNAQPTPQGDTADQVVIIEERVSKVNGDFTVKKYSKGKMLGKGGFAKCYEIVNLENKKVSAAKIIVKSSLTKTRARQKLISEIKIHKSLRHQYIVSFEHVFEDQENVYILLELCTNQTLNDLLKRRKRLTELEVQCYSSQIINALKYLHANKVIHRDLKLGNLFINDKMEIKLGDFGLATKLEFDGEKKKTICGTPNYIAPEILEGKTGHSYEVDVWSLGVIIYTLLVGKPPFETPDVKSTYKKIRMGSYSFPEHVPLSDAAKSLITKILNLEPSKRPTLDEIMEHPFINHGGSIPKVLPYSTLACPPSASYIKQFLPQGNTVKMTVQPQRLMETQPVNQQSTSKAGSGNPRNNLINTDKISLKNQEEPAQNNNQLGAATMNFNMTTSTQNLRPTSQQKDMKGSQGLKPIMGGTNFASTGGVGTSARFKPSGKNEVIVKKWVDYSSKYGLGYLLSNGMTGVFFNDSTKIILNMKTETFEYMERRAADKQDVVTTHTLTDYPKELQKKVTLLHHFKSFLEGESGANGTNPTEEEKNTEDNAVYVKKWMKTRHAIMFRLSNKIVQVNFTDKTEVILSSENKLVTYVNKKGERSHYPLATALDSNNAEMAKRLKYTKEILTHMLNNNAQGAQNNEKDGDQPHVDLHKDN